MKTSIKINDKYIQKILLGSTPVQRMYQSGSIVYEAGGSKPQPCFEVVSTISKASGDYVDVYVKPESKWYKKNNLNQYEEYGLMPTVADLSSTTYYTGKLVILSTDGNEYKWNGSEWIDLGNAGTVIYCIWLDPSSNNSSYNIGYYWGTGYKMVCNVYLSGSYGSDTAGFLNHQNQSPLEFNFYSNGFYLDMHDPQSTSNNSCYSGDYSDRLMQTSVLQNYQSEQVINFTFTYGTVKAELEEGGTLIGTWGTERTGQSWYNGLYSPSISIGSAKPYHLSRIQVYDNNNNLVNDLKFVENEGETGSQKLSMYDSVLDVKYENTNSNTPTYHIAKKGELNPPVDYDEKVAPSDNVHYNTLAELELMECPWIGMTATVGQDYTVYVYTENGWVPGEIPLDLPYLRFTALEDTTFIFTKSSYASQDLEVKYSIDGKPWKTMESGVATPTVPSGSYVLFKSNFNGGLFNKVANGTFSATGDFGLSGNSMSLIYGDEFENQLSLKGKSSIFHSLFKNCTKLKSLSNSVLPATTIDDYVYSSLFNGCTGLTSIPSGLLPSTELASGCYYEMFNSSGITSIPEGFLPATKLKVLCYGRMFANSEVTSIPSNLLPATKLETSCYNGLFQYTKITSIPSGLLPSTELKNSCYGSMFMGCESLKSANIELPATTVNNGYEYHFMFFGCSNLTDPPIIKATSVSGNNSFDSMFYGCGKMKYLVCDMLNEPSSSISKDWLKGVAATGTFYKNPNATWDQTITKGNDTVPTGWTITTLSEPEYLKFTTVDDNGSTYAFSKSGLEYSIDGGEWTTLEANTNTPNVPKNSNIRFRGNLTPNGSEGIGIFSSSGKFDAEGDLMTLLYGEYYVGQTGKYANYMFSELFMNSKVVDATNLVIPNAMGDYYYYKTFYSCTSLTSTPSLPFSEVGYYSCMNMFYGCTSLITIQPMTIGSNGTGAMYHMFYNCTSLVDASMITITNEKWDSCDSMFYRCTSLRKSPIIKCDINQNSCNYMFSYCSSLEEVVYLGTTEPKNYYSGSWLNGVSSTGTFYMNKNATWDSTVTRDADGVPASWTIVKVDPNNY